jgi:glycosyltransferase involved in cell wall biosynthesis
MNILVLTSTYSRWKDDTQPKFVDNLCQNLSSNNVIHVIAPHAAGIPTEEVLDGIPVFRFRYCFESWQTLAYGGGILPNLKQNRLRLLLVPLFIVSQLLLAIQLLRKNRYDVIHAHWIIPQGLVALLARPFARGRPAVVMTSHGGDLFALQGTLLSWLKKSITRRADAITVVSSAMQQQAVAMGLKAACDISVIPMGVDSCNTFIPPAPNVSRKGLLFVGRLVDKKGIEYLLQALPQVLASHPDQRLTVIGDGPLKQPLIELCTTLDISNQVTFTGPLTNRDIPRHLQSAAIAIFPSVVTDSGDQEGAPVAIMEALACGCATIAADYPGVRDIIRDKETGLIVAGKSPGEIANAILALLDDQDLRTTLSRNGRQQLQQQYDWRVVSDQFLTLFRTQSPVPSSVLHENR